LQFFELVLVLAFGAGDLLIAMEDPTGGQTFQIGTAVPVGATEVVWEVGEAGHD
jgi:hypothetical protein